MTWFKVDDGFYDHPKVEELPNAAVGLWTKAGTWCSKHETDGVVPATRVKALKGTASQIRALIDCGLWGETTTDSGAKAYVFKDWFDYQPSREEREEERQIWREKKKRERERKLNQARTEHSSESVSGASRAQNDPEHARISHANATQNESDLNSNGAQNDSKSRLQKDDYQDESQNVPWGVTQMSPEGTSEGVTQMSGTIPDPSRPDPTSKGGYGSQPTTGSRGQDEWLAGDPLEALADATRRARQAGISETAITAGSKRFNARTGPKGPGLLRTLINEEWEAEQIKNRLDAEKQARRARIDACDLCDDNGKIMRRDGLATCTHDPAKEDAA